MLNRLDFLKITGAAAMGAFLPRFSKPVNSKNLPNGPFRFCLNTSTILGQNPGLVKMIEIAGKAGYDGLELWVSDIRGYLKQGNSIESLNKIIKDNGLVVYDAISFTHWMVKDDQKRKAALKELEEEMDIMKAIGCTRIAAPPAGVDKGQMVDVKTAGAYYHDILELGRRHGVMPLLEFWGASGTLFNLGQALSVAAAANDPDARIIPDVYHMFRGGSGFNGLKMLNGNVIDIIHMNDYPGNKPVDQQTDADRVYPGDGVAPIKQILKDLKDMGGTKALSLELFNKTYWSQDAFTVAKTGLEKMKKLVDEVLSA